MGCNGANKHQLIHFHGQDDEPVQRHAQQQAHAGADEGQKLDLAEDVAVHFFVIEAQHLDGGKLLFALGKVDADQVVQHHRRQRRRAHDDQHHHVVQAADQAAEHGGQWILPPRG